MHEPTVMIAVLSDSRITRPRTKNLWLAPGARSSHDYPAAHYPLVALDLYELMDLQFALPSLCQAAVDLARKVLVRENVAFSQVRIDRMICRKSTLRSRG